MPTSGRVRSGRRARRRRGARSPRRGRRAASGRAARARCRARPASRAWVQLSVLASRSRQSAAAPRRRGPSANRPSRVDRDGRRPPARPDRLARARGPARRRTQTRWLILGADGGALAPAPSGSLGAPALQLSAHAPSPPVVQADPRLLAALDLMRRMPPSRMESSLEGAPPRPEQLPGPHVPDAASAARRADFHKAAVSRLSVACTRPRVPQSWWTSCPI